MSKTSQTVWLRYGRWVILSAIGVILASESWAHGVASSDQGFLARAEGVHAGPFLYLGAKHMVTGYDHLLYLAGVIFYLRALTDVVKFVSLFALGHSITLLFGVLSGINISPYFIDAIIGLSICYKALENLGTIRFIDPKLAVFGFGLAHGFGLSTKLQDLALSRDGLIANMINFNIGVEIGQVIGLVILFIGLSWLRERQDFDTVSRNANVALFGAGLVFFGLQMTGLFVN
ncbi:HupE/UreJ family protein [Candidatus Pelagisphaera phototrophica]|uniref:HupE/UreJ family protein n=1 Tax=Candidatus Pelagisphaera phototrophica TaxID=2684113 RepID=UPI001A085D42|nr:HupE/UreJ family protein [Candidatus Pelagisphaera phototrophica]QXD32002.1 HupE/UreJ family protein [Candidatus Pelagisphaera phototrophica]